MSKNRRKSRILHTFTNFLSIIFLFVFIAGISYTISIINNKSVLYLQPHIFKEVSSLYDKDGNFIVSLEKEDIEEVKYEDLPDVFIDALLSTEDVRFFLHNGIDIPRLLSALKTDILKGRYAEGASTLTQQLIKNTILSADKKLERKIEEAILALEIENKYSKKEIIEFYANYVCFDGINPGVNKASYKYLNKSIKYVTLPEAALLVGMLNMPTYYNPFKHPENAEKRKNEVLEKMYENKFISNYEYLAASSIHVNDMVIKSSTQEDETYPYQAYLDIVYSQISEKTGLDPYITPMKIYTNMDATLQSEIDLMQENKSNYLEFDNDLQQFAAAVIDNETGNLIGAFGGRNYQGKRLFNRAYDMLKQPASTIKIILSYALAFQYLNWSNMHRVDDVPTNYPNSKTPVNNVDYNYLGQILIDEAIGYSRNTIAVKTLEEVVQKIGSNKVIQYLKDINLFDNEDDVLNYAYALGGFKYGVSPVYLASAYSMLASKGIYREPLAVNKIELLDGSNQVFEFSNNERKILDEDSCYLLINVLESVMKKNFWSINQVKPNDVNVVAKTGTSSFDDSIISKYNYPKNAYKDRWLAGFSTNLSIAVWTGFDNTLEDEKTYFTPSSNDANVTKKFFRRIMDVAGHKNETFEKPNNLVEAKIVKGSYPYLLADSSVAKEYVVNALFKEGFEPKNYIQEPNIDKIVDYDYFMIDDELTIIINEEKKENNQYPVLFDLEKIYGGLIAVAEIIDENGNFITIEFDENIKTISLPYSGYYNINMYYKLKNGSNKGPISNSSFEYEKSFIF